MLDWVKKKGSFYHNDSFRYDRNMNFSRGPVLKISPDLNFPVTDQSEHPLKEIIFVLIPGAGAMGNRHSVPRMKRDYFKEFKEVLGRLDYQFVEVYGDELGTDGVEQRTYQVQNIIGRLGEEKNLILIGHSMGGLAARLAMRERNLRPMVQSIFTFNTPHRGTEILDLLFSGGKLASIARKSLKLLYGNLNLEKFFLIMGQVPV